MKALGSHYHWGLYDNHFSGKFELLRAKWWPPHFSAKFVIFHGDRIAGDYGLAPEPGSTQRNNMINNIPAAEPHRDPPLSVRNMTFRRPPTNKPPPSPLSLEMRRDEERLEIICCCSTSSIVYISKWHHVEIVLILKSIQIQHRGGKDRFKRKINYCIKVFQNNKNIT